MQSSITVLNFVPLYQNILALLALVELIGLRIRCFQIKNHVVLKFSRKYPTLPCGIGLITCQREDFRRLI